MQTTTTEELARMRKHLIKSNAPDVAFEAMDLAVPTQEERDSMDTENTDIDQTKKIIMDGLFKKFAPLVSKTPRKVNDLHMGWLETRNGEQVEFDLLTNVSKGEMELLLRLWGAVTSSHTPESLVEFINSKKEYGFYAELKK